MAGGLSRRRYRNLSSATVTTIYHITTRDAALSARDSGEYRAESLSREGFIHFSGVHQVLDVANRFYASQRGLVLLAVDTSLLKAELKYEAPVHPAPTMPKNEDFLTGERLKNSNERDTSFPHLYGPLNFDAVVAMYDFEPDPDGRFSLPADFAKTD